MFDSLTHTMALAGIMMGACLVMWSGGIFCIGGCSTIKHGGKLTHMQPIYCTGAVGLFFLLCGVRGPAPATADGALH
jgi:hypothetical protein